MCRTGASYKELHIVLDENNTENKPIVRNLPSKSPYRKHLTDLNTSMDTPKFICKTQETLLVSKPKTARKTTPVLKKTFKPLKKNNVNS